MDQFFHHIAVHVGETTYDSYDSSLLVHNGYVIRRRRWFVCFGLMFQFSDAFLKFLAGFLFLLTFFFRFRNPDFDLVGIILKAVMVAGLISIF